MASYTIPTFKVRLVRDGRKVSVRTPTDAVTALRKLCCDRGDRETMAVLYLDAASHIVGAETVAIGGRSSCATDPPSVLRGAIVAGASAIVLGHNHPSGDPVPSSEDHAMTKALACACNAVGIPLVDHVIVTDDNDHSMLEQGQL